ncbi:MarR family winged helix-turn-helix transcriptional regulator, partial [Liquorilactobacillus satsumensis]
YLGSITRKLNAELKIQLKELNVNVTEGNLLLFISEHPGLLQKEVAQGMFLDPGMITRDLQYLEARGDLVKAASPNSSRGKSIAVTTAGEAKAQKIKWIMDAWWEGVLQHFSEEQVESLKKRLEELYQFLSGH